MQEVLLNLIRLSNQTWFWKTRLCHIWNAVQTGLNIWHHFLFCENAALLPNYIVSKIKNIPLTGKFSKIKNKKITSVTFGEECIFISKAVFAVLYVMIFIRAVWDSPKSGLELIWEI